MTTDWSPTACILCECNCGIVVQTDVTDGVGHLTKIRGDKDHPGSKGYTCNKALRLDHYQSNPNRLTSPLRRRPDGSYEEIDWETAISEVAAGFREIADSHGGDKILYYGGGGQGNHLGGAYSGAFLKPIGSRYRSSALAQEKTGEFWVDAQRGMLVLWPNDTAAGPPPLLVLPVLETVLVIGAGADGVALEDLTFAHTTDALMAQYAVPAAGDWSVRRAAAVAVDGAADASLSRCTWARVGGNALLITGAARNTLVADADFYKPGGSAIAVVGYIPRADGVAANASYPDGVAIARAVAEGVGVLGKQTSALFVSLACRVSITDSVLFSGPRAGININDNFCGGHEVSRNVLADWVRETQDHGPFNVSWSTSCAAAPHALEREEAVSSS